MVWWITLALGLLAAGCGRSGSSGGPSLSEQYQQARQTPDPAARVTRLLGVADKQQQAGDPRGMDQSLTAAASAAEEIENPVQRISALNRVATALAQRDRLGDARKLLQAVSQSAEQIEPPALRVPDMARMAYIHARYLDNLGAADAYLDQCVEFADQADPEHPEDAVRAKLRLAYTYHSLEMGGQADAMIERMLSEAASLADPRDRTEIFGEAAAYLQKMDRGQQAGAAFAEAERAVDEIPEPLTRAHALVQLAEQLQAAGQGPDAERVLDQAEGLAEQVDGSLRGSLLQKIRRAR